MTIKKYKSTSNGRRDMTGINYKKDLTKTRPHKALTKGGKNTAARNSDGRITSRFRGGGNKRKFRIIDFKFDKKNIPAKVESIEYDPFENRCYIHIKLLIKSKTQYVDEKVRLAYLLCIIISFFARIIFIFLLLSPL